MAVNVFKCIVFTLRRSLLWLQTLRSNTRQRRTMPKSSDPSANLSNNPTPLDFFSLYLNDDILTKMAPRPTAKGDIGKSPRRASNGSTTPPPGAQSLFRGMRLIRLPHISHYLYQSEFWGHKFFKDTMWRRRCNAISRSLKVRNEQFL